MKYDIVIVGAGPAGLYSAKLCKEKGFRVAVLEEHLEIGKPMQCSGLISTNLKRFVKLNREWIEHKVKGAILHSPSGITIRLEKKNTAAYVINREKFDRFLSEDLESEIFLHTRARSVSINKSRAVVETQKDVFTSEIIFGCDGPHSLIRKHFGVRPKEMLTGIIALEDKPDDSEYVEIWFDKRLCADGFVWKIPRGSKTEHGMLSKKPSFRTLERLFNLGKYSKISGPIPMGTHKIHFARTLLIGDAASQVKPWSGGGVIYSLTAAKIAASVASKAFEKEDFSEEGLKEYEEKCAEKLNRNIQLGMMFREFYRKLSNPEIDKMFERFREMKFMNSLDMDFPIETLIGVKEAVCL